MLDGLFDLFWSVLNGMIAQDFFIALMAVGVLFGICSLIRYVFQGE